MTSAGEAEILTVLRGMWGEMKALNERLNSQIAELRGEMRGGFATVTGRIDNLLLGPHREHHEGLEARVERLERRAGFGARKRPR